MYNVLLNKKRKNLFENLADLSCVRIDALTLQQDINSTAVKYYSMVYKTL